MGSKSSAGRFSTQLQQMTRLPTPNAIQPIDIESGKWASWDHHSPRTTLSDSWANSARGTPPYAIHSESWESRSQIRRQRFSSFPPRRKSKRRPLGVLPSPLRARFCCGFVSMRRSGCCIWMTGSCRMVNGSYPMIRYPWKRLPKRSSLDRRAETRMVD